MWLALIPPLATLVMVILTRRVVISLGAAVILGSLLKTGFSVNGLVKAGEYIAGAVFQKENAYILIFLVLFGALAELIKVGGGVGFTNLSERWIKSERGVLLASWAMFPFTFFDSTFRMISIGSILNPLMESVKGSKERLAFILSITSGQAIVFIPLATAYVGYMVSLVRANFPASHGLTPFTLFLKSLPWNIYSLIMLAIALGVTFWGLGFGKLKLNVAGNEEKFTKVHEQRESLLKNLPPEFPPRLWNLLIPILSLLIFTIFFFWWTGRNKANTFINALGAADFTVAITVGTLLGVILTIILFRFEKINFAELEAHVLEGAKSVMPLLAILILSWALSHVIKDLGFSRLVVSVLGNGLPGWMIPGILFLIGAVISFLIGSSWATWAMLMPLAAALYVSSGINPALIIGTIWAGGVVGDSTSPFSDNPIIVSGILKISVVKYTGQVLPYALGGIFLAVIGYIIAGLSS